MPSSTEPAAPRWLTLLLFSLPIVAIDQANRDPRALAALTFAQSLFFIGLMVLAATWIARSRLSGIMINLACGLALAAPMVIDGLFRWWLQIGWPMETVHLSGLRNLLLTFGVLCSRPFFANLGAGVSVFGFLFALGFEQEGTHLAGLFGIYLVTACGWLMRRHWSTISGPTGVPWAPFGLAVSVVLTVFLSIEIGPTQARRVLGEWMGSSGGTQRHDPFARGGVGLEGQDTVDAKDQPKSEGGQGESYLQSEEPSFYDVVTETLGDPFHPKHRNRAIALAGQKIQQVEKYAKHRQMSKQFSIYRQSSTPTSARPKDLDSDAVLLVTGQAPLHVPVKVFDLFDGLQWREETVVHDFRMIQAGLLRWMQLVNVDNGRTLPLPRHFGTAHRHQVKVLHWSDRVLPLPSQSSAFQIGLVDRPNFFGFLQTGLVGLTDHDAKLPINEVIDVESHASRSTVLAEIEFPASCHFAQRSVRSLIDESANADERAWAAAVTAIAQEWVGDRPRGWRQIEAIIARLRSAPFVVDAEARATGDQDAILEFLTSTHRGPDYLFASSAVLLLRSLGYPVHLAAGYYIDPQKYDSWTKTTPVHSADLHFWAELLLPDGWTTTLEPTPGYDRLPHWPTWDERLARWLHAWVESVQKHPVLATLGCVAVVLLAWSWRRWLAGIYWLIWQSSHRRDWRTCVTATAWLLDRRGRLAGCGRPQHQTLRAWSQPLTDGRGSPQHQQALLQLIELTDRAWFAPAGNLPQTSSSAQVRQLCQQTVRLWTFHHLRRRYNPGTSRTPA